MLLRGQGAWTARVQQAWLPVAGHVNMGCTVEQAATGSRACSAAVQTRVLTGRAPSDARSSQCEMSFSVFSGQLGTEARHHVCSASRPSLITPVRRVSST